MVAFRQQIDFPDDNTNAETHTLTFGTALATGSVVIVHICSRPITASGDPPDEHRVTIGGRNAIQVGTLAQSTNHSGSIHWIVTDGTETNDDVVMESWRAGSRLNSDMQAVAREYDGWTGTPTQEDFVKEENTASSSSITTPDLTPSGTDRLSEGHVNVRSGGLTGVIGTTVAPAPTDIYNVSARSNRFRMVVGWTDRGAVTTAFGYTGSFSGSAQTIALGATWYDAAGAGATATITIVEADDTLTVAATHVAPTATAAVAVVSEDDIVAVAAVHVAPGAVASVAIVAADDTVTVAATHVAPGAVAAVAITEDDDVLAVSATHTPPVHPATITIVEADDVVAVSATFESTAAAVVTIVETDDVLAISATSIAPPGAFVAITQEDDTLAVTASSTPPTFTATITITETDDALTVAANHTAPTATASIDIGETDDALTVAATATAPGPTATIAITAGDDTVNIAAAAIPPTLLYLVTRITQGHDPPNVQGADPAPTVGVST